MGGWVDGWMSGWGEGVTGGMGGCVGADLCVRPGGEMGKEENFGFSILVSPPGRDRGGATQF